ncbi:MAG: hypothetical protein Q9157_005238, partial [Trypethelium eluteriae]
MTSNRCEPPDWQKTDPEQQELSALLEHLKQDISLLGCISLGKDGVLRSLTADRDVVDAIGLKPSLCAALLKRIPPGIMNKADYESADGTKVSKEAWFHPEKSLLPPPLDDETKARSLKAMEDDPESSQLKRDKLKKTWED